MSSFRSSSRIADAKKPTSGDTSRVMPTFCACAQSTPPAALPVAISWFARPTPMIDPMSVCELDAGRPSAQVPRFQMMAPISSAKTIANPALDPTCRINSTGRSATMP